MAHILVVDDDIYISNLLREALTKAGYTVSCVFSGIDAMQFLKTEKPDLILLDLMLPGISGEELLPHIGRIPVIVVSAKAESADKVSLLMSGAADYITKPFDMQELLARIAVQLRSSALSADGSVLTFDNLTLDVNTLTVTAGANQVRLTRTECAILKLLMQNAGTPVGRSTILDRISMDTPDCTEHSLRQHISNIRKKLLSAGGKDYIEAVYGIGFCMKS